MDPLHEAAYEPLARAHLEKLSQGTFVAGKHLPIFIDRRDVCIPCVVCSIARIEVLRKMLARNISDVNAWLSLQESTSAYVWSAMTANLIVLLNLLTASRICSVSFFFNGQLSASTKPLRFEPEGPLHLGGASFVSNLSNSAQPVWRILVSGSHSDFRAGK